MFLKQILLLLLWLWLLMADFRLAFAQNEQSDYRYQYEKYVNDYQTFGKAKDEYAEYQTLASKEKMLTALKSLLVQRDETLRTYWLLLRKKLRDSPGLVIGEKNELINLATQETIFLDTHRQKIAAVTDPTLQDLITLSAETEAKKDQYLPMAYKMIAMLMIGQIKDRQADANSINSLFNEELNRYPANEKNLYRAWVEEAQSAILQSQEDSDQAKAGIAELEEESEEKNIKTIFAKIENFLQDSRLALEKGFGYQQELMSRLEE